MNNQEKYCDGYTHLFFLDDGTCEVFTGEKCYLIKKLSDCEYIRYHCRLGLYTTSEIIERL